jgi:O-antigen ligase
MRSINIKKLTKTGLTTKMHILVLTLIFFSGACLYDLDSLNAYIMIIVGVSLYTLFYCLNDLRRVTIPLQKSFFWWIVVLFGMYTFYGTMLPVYGEYNTDYMLFVALIILNVVFLFSTMGTQQSTNILIKASVYASMLICLYIGVNEWDSILAGNVRIGESGSGNVNTVGIYLGMLSIPVAYKIICEQKGKYLFIYGIQIIFMLLTGSKKALLFIFIGFILLLVLKNRWHLHRYFIPSMVLIAVIMLVMNNSLFYNIIGFRVIDFLGTLGFNVSNYYDSNSTNLRLMMYKLGWEAFKEHPLSGGGYFYFSHYSGLGTYTHNNYLELLVNYGILGFVLYYSMFFNVIKRVTRFVKESDMAKLYFTIIIVILINDSAAVMYNGYLNYVACYFAYMFCLSWRNN